MTGLISPAGELALDYAYAPFGNETTAQTSYAATWDNPFRYCGEYWDEETETYYLRTRQYDPAAGRFLSEDTYWNPNNITAASSSVLQSVNLYLYCGNNPIMFHDPSGNAWETVFDALSFIASFKDMCEEPSWENLAYLGWDVLALAAPVVPGSYVGDAIKTLDNLDDVGDAVKEIGKVKIPRDKNFRKNLMKFTGVADASGLEAHHVLPHKFIGEFQSIGININDPKYGAWVDAKKHVKWSSKYNKEWEEFLSVPGNRTKEKVLEQAEKMSKEYKFAVNWK